MSSERTTVRRADPTTLRSTGRKAKLLFGDPFLEDGQEWIDVSVQSVSPRGSLVVLLDNDGHRLGTCPPKLRLPREVLTSGNLKISIVPPISE